MISDCHVLIGSSIKVINNGFLRFEIFWILRNRCNNFVLSNHSLLIHNLFLCDTNLDTYLAGHFFQEILELLMCIWSVWGSKPWQWQKLEFDTLARPSWKCGRTHFIIRLTRKCNDWKLSTSWTNLLSSAIFVVGQT